MPEVQRTLKIYHDTGQLFERLQMTKPTVGLIGVGEMGLPMGINLMSAGFPLVAYDV